MKKALMGASAAAVIALAPLCIPPAQAHADDPCVSISDPAALQACINESVPDDPMYESLTDDPKSLTDDLIDTFRMGDCQASPDYGQVGQFCR